MTIKVTYNVTDVYMSQSVSPVYINVSYSDGGASGGGVWGSITGTLSNQTDLQTALDAKVPYTGATGNVDLGEYELKAGQVEFDQTPTGTAGVGVMRWNDADGTVDLGLKGGNVTLQVGQEQVARVVNKTGANLLESEYKVVKVSSAQGQRLAVDLAQANNDNNSADTLGIVTENIDNNQEGFITTLGTIRGINTTGSLQGETWTDGDVLYLSGTTAGAITNVKPTAPLHIVVVGYVEYAHQNNGKIYVKVMNGWELDELHNVSIVTPTNNQGLFYNSSNSLWENKSIATVLGYTPEQPLTFNSPLSRAGNVVSIPQATGSVNGFLSATDWTTFNSKQAALGYTPANAATTLTINGVTFDLSANRSWTIAAGISGSGTAGQVTYWTGASAVSGSNNLFWDNANGRLGIGTNVPARILDIAANINSGTEQIRIKNSNTGSSATSAIAIESDGAYSALIATSSTYSALSFLGPNAIGFYATKTFSISIAANNEDFKIGIGSTLTQRLRLYGSTGNLVLQNGGTFTDGGQRLQVIGDTLLRGSGNTSATTALTVQNSSSTDLLRVRNDGNTIVGTGTPTSAYLRGLVVSGTTGDINTSVFNSSTTGTTGFTLGQSNTTYAAFVKWGSAYAGNFPASSIPLANSSQFQSGETNNLPLVIQGTPIIFNVGNTATNIASRISAGSFRITTLANAHTNGTALLDLDGATTSYASLRIRSGTAPTTPNDGDIWFDGTDIKMRIGGVTKTFTLI